MITCERGEGPTMSWDASLVPRLFPVHQQNLSPCDEDLASYPDSFSCALKGAWERGW